MSPHFRAFSFVDRIISLEDRLHVRGLYTIPAGVSTFPVSLAAEAVGQLAAWAAMAEVDFQSRPLAGLGGAIEYLSSPRPGQVLELSAELESIEADAVAYGGVATVDGIPVVRLKHCVGPMVPVADFDDPGAVRERFSLLRGAGAAPGGFSGLPPISFSHGNGTAGGSMRGTLQVPASADFFADHFPRRPVFPGSLLMHLNLELAAKLIADFSPAGNGGGWKPRWVRDVKLRAFIPPGEILETRVRIEDKPERSASVLVETHNAKRLVGGARIDFIREANA